MWQPLVLLCRAVVAPLALSGATGHRSALRDLGLVAALTVVGAAWFVCGDDAHALLVAVALWRLGSRGWRAEAIPPEHEPPTK